MLKENTCGFVNDLLDIFSLKTMIILYLVQISQLQNVLNINQPKQRFMLMVYKEDEKQ